MLLNGYTVQKNNKGLLIIFSPWLATYDKCEA